MSDSFCSIPTADPTYPQLIGSFPPIGYASTDPATTLYYLAQTSYSADLSNAVCVFIDLVENELISFSPISIYTYDFLLL
jgi:hypothetical protein